MKPYYHDEASGITIYHGDCREVLPSLPPVEAMITDPVWPKPLACLTGADNPGWSDGVRSRMGVRQCARRIVIQVSVTSDPRWFRLVPSHMKFQRSLLLEYARPAYRGRHLSGDRAYVFGDCPASGKGKHILPGRTMATNSRDNRKAVGHPTPRKLEHLQWLVKWWSEREVLDPFMGSGTTLLAAKGLGRRAIGIEIEERYCEIAAKRLEQEVLDMGAA